MAGSWLGRGINAVSMLFGIRIDLEGETQGAGQPGADRAIRYGKPRRVTVMVRRFAQVLGVTYILTGVVGFLFTGFRGGEVTTLLIFDFNATHNALHTVVGLAFLASSVSEGLARSICTLAGGTYLAIGVVGLLLIGSGDLISNGDLNVLALNQADNALHILSGGFAIYVGLAGENDAVVRAAAKAHVPPRLGTQSSATRSR
jgi:hypothetical protein